MNYLLKVLQLLIYWSGSGSIIKLRAFLLILSILFITSAYAEDGQIRFKHITVEDGLSQNWIKEIIQDSYGYLWFGTGGNGVNKYNSYDFEIYKNNLKDEKSISKNWVSFLYEDRDKNLWISTQGKLNRYNRESDNFIRIESLRNEKCVSFYETKQGDHLVIAVNGIFKINPEDFTVQTLCDSCIHMDIFVDAVSEDVFGNLWLGSTGGMRRYDLENNVFSTFNNNPDNPLSISDNAIECLIKDNQGRIWMGTRTQGVSLMQFHDGDTLNPYFINFRHNPSDPTSISSGAVKTLLDDGEGRLWIGLENGGLDIVSFESIEKGDPVFKHYTHNKYDESSISGNSIYSLYKDNQGTIWVGTYGNGLNYYNKQLFDFEHYKHMPTESNSLPNDLVNVIYKDGDDIWIGTEGGISLFNKDAGSFKNFTHDPHDKNSIGSNAIWSIFKDSRNNLWFGNWTGGLNLYNKDTESFTHFMHDVNNPNSIRSNHVFGIAEDKEGVLWIACMNGGLNRFDYETNSFKSYYFVYDAENGISGDWVRTILINSIGEIWLATTDGVDLFDKETEQFVSFYNDPEDSTSISYNGAIMLFEDSKQNMWFGTEGGLNYFVREDSSFRYYSEKDGLPDNSIKGICEDDKGNLWLSSNRGLTKFIDGTSKPSHPDFISFGISDGLQGEEFNRRSCFKDENGYMYFGGIHGLNVFHPDSLRENTFKPPVVFTDFLIFNKSVNFLEKDSPIKKHISAVGDEEIILSYRESIISFQFAALSYLAPEKNNFRYFMKGFDKEWYDVGNKREATYTNLNPGEYSFHVKASNNDGIWNEKGTYVRIKILPPWWKTIWFRIIIVLFVIGVLFAFYSYRVSNLTKQKIRLEELVNAKTNDLYEANTLLEERQQNIEEQAEELQAQKDSLEQTNQNLYKTNSLLKERQIFIENQSKQLKTQNKELNVLNATKDRFFSIIAHDLKNPFSTVLGFSELLATKAATMDRKKMTHLLDSLHISSQRVYSLLENLLQWSRAQTGNIKVKKEEVLIEELVRNNLELVQDMASSKNIILNSKIPNGTTLYVDHNLLDTVFRNLITNAIKFTEKGSVEIFVNTLETSTELCVKDSGVGISSENIKNLFKIDKNTTTSGTRDESGTGLGLLICKEFIELNGGKLLIQSKVGEGSTFSISLPKI